MALFMILENVPHELKKDVHSGTIGWNILYIYIHRFFNLVTLPSA